jgi:hypothetical protein
MTVRDFLQILGTEAMREGLHKNTWVNALLADYKAYNVSTDEVGNVTYRMPHWLITDTRFPNELAAVREKGGIAIKVVRDNTTDIGATHSSETALDHITNWNYVIDNNGSIEDLKQQLSRIILW